MCKKFLCFFILLTIVGCASINIPKYIKNENPYSKKFYANFEKVLSATIMTLESQGWEIEEKVDPGVYEMRIADEAPETKQVLLITSIRRIPLFVASKYARLNIYITSGVEGSTDVEVRYLMINSVTFKNFHDYSHDQKVEKLLKKIENNIAE